MFLFCLLWAGGPPSVQARRQAPGPQPRFDVASVKLLPEGTAPIGFVPAHPGYVRYAGVTLEQLIRQAYGIPSYAQVSGGPDWLHSGESGIKFVVEARFSPEGAQDQVPAMLQALLADRFGLVLHTETMEMNVLELRADQGLGKLLVHTDGAPKAQITCPPEYADYKPSKLLMTGAAPSRIANLLTMMAGRPVVDKTGLTGTYDFGFCYPYPNTAVPPGLPPPPSIEAAVRDELGLRLVAARDQVARYVIDHAVMPSAN